MRARVLTAGACAAAVLALSGCGLSFQSLPKVHSGLGPHYTVTATFADVLNLPSDAQVRIGPRIVGAVSSIRTQDFAAKVDLDIEKSVQLPAGTTAEVRFDNPLGDQYVLLSPPAAGASGASLGDGAAIPAADTRSAPSVEEAFGALSAVLNGGGISQLQTIISELNDSFDGNQQQVRDLLTGLDAMVGTLAQGRTAVTDALAAIDRLSGQLDNGVQTITTGIDTIAPAVQTLASQNSEISALLTQFSHLSDSANRIITESGADSVQGVRSLLPVLDQLVGVQQRLGSDLSDLAALSQSLKGKTPGDYLQVSVDLHVALPSGSAPPVSVGAASRASSGGDAVRALLQGGLR